MPKSIAHRSSRPIVIALPLLLAAALHAQQPATPIGLWQTVDDATKQPKSHVRIIDSNGMLYGRVEKLLDPAKADARCDACTDDRKGQPVVGMTILRDAKKSARDDALWEGGEILDPNNGKTYKARLQVKDGGKSLEVRGYIGTPLLGRTQTWVRVE